MKFSGRLADLLIQDAGWIEKMQASIQDQHAELNKLFTIYDQRFTNLDQGLTELTTLEADTLAYLRQLINIKLEAIKKYISMLQGHLTLPAVLDHYEIQDNSSVEKPALQEEDIKIYWMSRLLVFLCIKLYDYDPRNDCKLNTELQAYGVSIIEPGQTDYKKRVRGDFHKNMARVLEGINLEYKHHTFRYYLRLGVLGIMLIYSPLDARKSARTKQKTMLYKFLTAIIEDHFINDFERFDGELDDPVPPSLLLFIKRNELEVTCLDEIMKEYRDWHKDYKHQYQDEEW